MNITWEDYRKALIDSAKLTKIPLLGEFELTARCNLRCKMCYVCRPVNDQNALKREYTAAEWIDLAKEARDAGMLYILLTGGEVLLREDFKEIYEGINRLGLIISLNTNGTMITPDIAKWLGRIPPSITSVTLYGASPETYSQVCGDESGFERTLRGIDLLQSAGIKVQLRTTIIHKNVSDFEKMRELATKRGLELGIVNYVSPRREGALTFPTQERLSPEEFIRFLDHIGYKFKDYSGSDADKKRAYRSETEDITGSSFVCSSGKCSFWITWDGRMTPCALLDVPSVKVRPNYFTDSWKQFQSLCKEVPSCGNCQTCNYKSSCMTCPAKLKNETGCFDKPARYLCSLAKELSKKL